MKKLIPCILALVLLLGCASQEQKHTATILAMDTVMTLTAYGSQGETALTQAQQLINQLDAQLSLTREDSETNAINGSNGESVTVSATMLELVRQSVALGDSTGGALDVTLTPVIQAWGFIGGDYRVPEPQELADLLERVDYQKISVDTANNTMSLPENMAVSFGAIAKGYTGDLVMEQMKSAGVTSAIVTLGGNVQALGRKPDGSLWNVALQSPFGSDYLGTLEVEDVAVVTSGGYERYFQQEGETYWHIIDPATGYPAKSGLVSVTIVCDSGITADGLSTALFVMGLEDALDYWCTNGGFEAIFVTDDNKVYITPGLEGSFTLEKAYADLPLTVVE